MDLSKHNHKINPRSCFCQVPVDKLKKWASEKYVEHRDTIELLNSTNDAKEREIIAIVALFDLDEKTMLEMMGNVNKPEHHIINCRERTKNMLNIKIKK